MKTGIEIEDDMKQPKITKIKLIKVTAESKTELGECEIDLSVYSDSLDQKNEVKEFNNSDGATIDFSIRATQIKVKRK